MQQEHTQQAKTIHENGFRARMAIDPPASHEFADLSALAKAASTRSTWWRIARVAQAGEPAATRPLRSAVGELTRRKRAAQHTPEAPEEE